MLVVVAACKPDKRTHALAFRVLVPKSFEEINSRAVGHNEVVRAVRADHCEHCNVALERPFRDLHQVLEGL